MNFCFGGYPRDWFLTIGRDFASRARFAIHCGFARKASPENGEIPFIFYWSWSSTRLPGLVWSYGRLIGVRAFGRCWVWPQKQL
ncbi:hypothetical protein AOQ73_05795 [Bradyrhizobium pachyrhizi]|nr:hypothetical protein AOQ73_05795 [Bradyrhizobium pachyrhizi]